MPSSNLSSLLKLPSKQRMELAESLWLSVAEEGNLPLSPKHKKIVRSRLDDYRGGKAKAISHQELMKLVRDQ